MSETVLLSFEMSLPGRSSEVIPAPEAGFAVRPPSASVIGVAIACTRAPSERRINSTPAVRLPHWSEPPVWSVQPWRR